MNAVNNFGLYVDPHDIEKLQCIHSKAEGFLIKNWQQIWDIELEDSDTALAVFCNEEVKYFTFQPQTKSSTFLAGVQVGGQIFLLQTVTLRQKQPFSPFCSKCSRQSCVHWSNYKSSEEHQGQFVFNHLLIEENIVGPAWDEQEEVPEDEPEEELGSENLEDTENHEDTEVNEESDLEELHWRKLPSIDVYHKLYGYNISDIVYPFHLDQNLQAGWMERMGGNFSFPAQ